ncbi:bcl-2-related ovarian killer protein homolog A isoform X1 [Amphiprion ocellaris]|uniref:Bcl-2 Bcl-2 homology region 1-3 domain-containing protein n=1 Tax=Amphiprion ocellaris TaxID=80972 RepID=A0AAQ5Z136_AMPOC|nr:bcl-2-related ovarian killer protein homolog A isoform X1 [Amphiprion ocellaris]
MEMLRRSSVFAAEVFDRSPTDKELVSQAKALCRDYIHSRLNRAGIGWSKPEHGLAASGGTLGEVSGVLLWLGDELEYLRPNVYRNVARQLNITVASESIVSDAFLAVAADIFSTGVTWGKVVSLYAVAGALAVDCVRHGHPAMVHTIVDCMGEFVRKSLTSWLKRRGGWVQTSVVSYVTNLRNQSTSHSSSLTCDFLTIYPALQEENNDKFTDANWTGIRTTLQGDMSGNTANLPSITWRLKVTTGSSSLT